MNCCVAPLRIVGFVGVKAIDCNETPATTTVTPTLGVSRLPLSSTARPLMVSEPPVMGIQV